jgi:DNA-binding transcriptional ArsR family regulator
MKFDCCTFFKAVSDPTRVKIMALLADREMNVTEICEHFDMKQPSISHHLNILKNVKIVASRKEGKEVFYSLNRCCVSGCCQDFMDRFGGEEE